MRLLNRAPIVLRGIAPPLSERQALRAVRIPHVKHIDDVSERGVRAAVNLAWRRSSTMTDYAAVFRTLPIEEATADAIVIAGGSVTLRSASLAKMLERALEVTLLAVSLGDPWDAALDELASRREAAEAWFLDAMGTLLADRAARLVEDRVSIDMARAGLTRTRRYRPGYGDFSIEAQGPICALVEADRIGVTVNEASSLLPLKSITGVLGFRPREAKDLVDGARPRKIG